MSERTALVIGIRGGIGSAVAAGLGARGWSTVLGTARRPGAADFTLDLEDEGSIRGAAAAVRERAPQLDLLFLGSGVLHDGALAPEKRLEDLQGDGLAKSFAVNAIGPALVARHFFPLLRHDRRAVFAALSARVGSIGDNRLGGWYAYRASKAALNQLIKTLSIEAGRRAKHLICVGLHPGTVDTALSEPFQGNVPAEQLFTPAKAATHLLDVIDGLDRADSGRVFAWDGQPIPW